MKLASDWKRIVRKAWSVRLLVLAAALSGIEVALPFFQNTMPRGLFALLSFLSVAGAFAARLIAQKEFNEQE